MNDDDLSDLAGDLASLLDGLRDESGRRIMADLARSADPGGSGVVTIDLLRGRVLTAGTRDAAVERPLTSVRRMVDQLARLRGGDARSLRSATVEVHLQPLTKTRDTETYYVAEPRYFGRLEVTDATGRRGWADVRG